MRVLSRWPKNRDLAQVLIYQPRESPDREVMSGFASGLLLTTWALNNLPFAIRRRGKRLYIGLARDARGRSRTR